MKNTIFNRDMFQLDISKCRKFMQGHWPLLVALTSFGQGKVLECKSKKVSEKYCRISEEGNSFVEKEMALFEI